MSADCDERWRGNAIIGSQKLLNAILRAARPKPRPRPNPLTERAYCMAPLGNGRIHLIQHIVAQHFQISVDKLLVKSRSREYVEPRQVAMYLCRLAGMPFPFIGKHFRRDHTTVIHAVRAVASSDTLTAYSQVIYANMAAQGLDLQSSHEMMAA